jgi:hypothetical protein
LKFFEMDKSNSKTGKIWHIVIQKLGCIIHSIFKASITNLEKKKKKVKKLPFVFTRNIFIYYNVINTIYIWELLPRVDILRFVRLNSSWPAWFFEYEINHHHIVPGLDSLVSWFH